MRSATFGDALTARELEVLRLMAEGCSNLEIGRRLLVSEDTVKTHARHMFKKLGANDRAHATALGYETGLMRAAACPPEVVVAVMVPRSTHDLLLAVAEQVVAGRPVADVRRAAVEALAAAGRRTPLVPAQERRVSP